MEPLFTINFGEVDSVVAFVSSMAIILGALFVVFEIRDNQKMIQAATDQAKAAAIQAESSAQQTKQNIQIANMDIIMRLYEFANSREVQTAWLSVINSKLNSFEDFQNLSRDEQVSFYQIASLFESVGVLLDRGIIDLKTVDDMFLPELAWERMKPMIDGLNSLSGLEGFPYFAKLSQGLQSKGTEAGALSADQVVTRSRTVS